MIESVPNVSEGRQPDVLAALSAAVRGVPGVLVLDQSADPSHNRSVFTLAGDADAVRCALLDLMEVAVQRIDLRTHDGVHPRIGAVDVVPFIPLAGSTMAECVALSHAFGRAVAERWNVPVFLYEHSATRPGRRRLEAIRKGSFEGLGEKLRKAEWHPDYGPARPHPSAGAIVVGARMPLVAFNVNLATADVAIARQIAAAIRESSGGLPAVKALGLWLAHRGLAQVSMNLTDYTVTPVQAAFDAVCREASRCGVHVVESELIGLIPEAALNGTTPDALRLRGFTASQILERRIQQVQNQV